MRHRRNTNRSVGPDVVVRGNNQQIVEKYHGLADEAYRSRDNVLYHSYMQHAEHYKRVGG